jgi:hypothetical protein
MTNQEHITLFLSILIGFLVYGLLILKKSLKEHNLKLQEQLDKHKIETRKEFERIRFTEKPICKVGDIYNKKFVVTKAKYVEYDSYIDCNCQPLFLLQITNEYELLDLETKEQIHFRSNYLMQKFMKENNLKITKIGK